MQISDSLSASANRRVNNYKHITINFINSENKYKNFFTRAAVTVILSQKKEAIFMTKQGQTKAARKQQRELGRLKFFYQHWTYKEIAEWLGVSENTIGKWGKEDEWKKEKRSLTQSREQSLLDAYKQLEEINANIAKREEGFRFPTKDERLARKDLRREIREMEAGSGIREVIDVSQAILNWLRAFDPVKAIEVSGIFDQYIKDTIR